MKFATSLNKNLAFVGETPAAAPDNEQATGKYIFSRVGSACGAVFQASTKYSTFLQQCIQNIKNIITQGLGRKRGPGLHRQ
jgi:hypothetical protein